MKALFCLAGNIFMLFVATRGLGLPGGWVWDLKPLISDSQRQKPYGNVPH